MKKIVLASAAMGGAALLAFGASGTFAAFTDGDTVTSDAASAGTLVLVADEPAATTEALDVMALAPGESVTFATPVTNGGSVDGSLYGYLTAVSQDDNLCVGPEALVDTTCGPGQGELVSQLLVTSSYGVLEEGDVCDEDADLPAPYASDRPFSEVLQPNLAGGKIPLPAGRTACSVLTLALQDLPNNNIVQSDSVKIQFEWTLTSVTQSA